MPGETFKSDALEKIIGLDVTHEFGSATAVANFCEEVTSADAIALVIGETLCGKTTLLPPALLAKLTDPDLMLY